MIRDHTIICVASSWFDHPTSKHHLMRLLAEQNQVVWVNYHASRRPTTTGADARAIAARLRRAWRGPQQVAPGLHVLSPVLVPWPESRLARRLNTRRLAAHIHRLLRRLPHRPLQLWLFTPDVPELIPCLDCRTVVYYCVDDFAGFANFNAPLISRLEAETVARSDVVIVTSAELYRRHEPRHARVHLVPHGVDYEHFAAATSWPAAHAAPELRGLPHPLIGYFGLVSEYVDFAMLAEAARRRPNWSFVLIGQQTCPAGPLAGRRNVHLLGPRPYAALPAYAAQFEVGMIPFQLTRLTRAANPIKLREYLAAGLPVVASPLPAVAEYAPAVRTATSAAEFIAACEAALQARSPAEQRARQELVRGESWRRRVADLSAILADDPPAGPPDRGAARAAMRPRAGLPRMAETCATRR